MVMGANDAAAWIRRLMDAIGCQTRFEAVGVVDDPARWRIIHSVNIERPANNPRRLNHEALYRMLFEA